MYISGMGPPIGIQRLEVFSVRKDYFIVDVCVCRTILVHFQENGNTEIDAIRKTVSQSETRP